MGGGVLTVALDGAMVVDLPPLFFSRSLFHSLCFLLSLFDQIRNENHRLRRENKKGAGSGTLGFWAKAPVARRIKVRFLFCKFCS